MSLQETCSHGRPWDYDAGVGRDCVECSHVAARAKVEEIFDRVARGLLTEHVQAMRDAHVALFKDFEDFALKVLEECLVEWIKDTDEQTTRKGDGRMKLAISSTNVAGAVRTTIKVKVSGIGYGLVSDASRTIIDIIDRSEKEDTRIK